MSVLYPHTVTVYPGTVHTDADGNMVRSASEIGTEVAAFVQPRASADESAGPDRGGPSQRTRVDAVAYLPHDCPTLDTATRIHWGEQPYCVVGVPLDQQGIAAGAGGLRYWRAELQRTGASPGE